MANKVYVGIDIGGSLIKVALISKQKIDQQCEKVSIKGDEFYLHSKRFQKVIECIEWIKNTCAQYDSTVIGATGGGAVKYDELLRESFPSVSISMHNQFQSNVKGIQFIKQTQLSVDIYRLNKHKQQGLQQTIISTQKQSKITEDLFPIIFVSYGSGANFHKIVIGANGLQRQKVDIDLSIDGYMLDGTCLGAGYIYGLISSLSGEPSNKIRDLLKENSKYMKIGKSLVQNSLQIAITLSDIHKAQTIMPIGSILSVIQPFQCFNNAFKQIISPLEHRKNLIELRKMPGFLGAIGVLYLAMLNSK